MTQEQVRLADDNTQNTFWKKFGPYLTERQWGTVREDYSAEGNAWGFISHDMARSYAYRWGEEGIAGISDDQQLLCFSVGVWNGRDHIIKERLFGLNNYQGNHGEDVKEHYYYLDSTPTHSYMKMLYKYPQREFPYEELLVENARRTREEPEFELLDTGVFDDGRYFDVFVEYAKAGPDDILIQITVHNRGLETARLQVLPQLWFRNTWSWGYDDYQPQMRQTQPGTVQIEHEGLGNNYQLYCEQDPSCFSAKTPPTAPSSTACLPKAGISKTASTTTWWRAKPRLSMPTSRAPKWPLSTSYAWRREVRG
ncbi:hypothetical protein [Hymenobacter volaticus]|uniref:hypothetical protein n=1 Tax=Hymenobacter volaticus TaxID=2932254 RepID=UPI0035CB5702